MRRLFVADLPAEGGEVELAPESQRHAQVLRLTVGTGVRLFDGRGHEADAIVRKLDRAGACCEASPSVASAEPRPRLSLVIGLPKADKLELITRMATELGVHAIYPAVTLRSVPRPSKHDAKHERLQRITREACAQSGQSFAPVIDTPRALLESARQAPNDAQKVVFWENASSPLCAMDSERDSWAVIGPEGGLDASEVEALEELGFTPIGLGRAKLRMETAAVVAATMLLDRLGRLRA